MSGRGTTEMEWVQQWKEGQPAVVSPVIETGTADPSEYPPASATDVGGFNIVLHVRGIGE